MKALSQKGFSLVQTLVAVGAFGGAAMMFMQLSDNMAKSQASINAKMNEMELRQTINQVIDNKNFCKVSFENTVFYKQNNDEDSEGVNSSLYFSNHDGSSRTLKKVNGANNVGSEDLSQFGKLVVSELKLIFNNPDAFGNLNFNYPD